VNTKIKRFLLIIFLILIVNDLCQYTRHINLEGLNLVRFDVFYATLSSGIRVYNFATIFVVVCALINLTKFYISED